MTNPTLQTPVLRRSLALTLQSIRAARAEEIRRAQSYTARGAAYDTCAARAEGARLLARRLSFVI